MADKSSTLKDKAVRGKKRAKRPDPSADGEPSQAELDTLAARVQEQVAAQSPASQPLDQAETGDAGHPADAAPGGSAATPAVVGPEADAASPGAAEPLETPQLTATATAQPLSTIDLLDDVELDVKIELGRTQMYIEDVLRLGVGSVVELDKLAGDPVDIYVNERIVARGEVLVLNDNFCVRINDVLSSTADTEDDK